MVFVFIGPVIFARVMSLIIAVPFNHRKRKKEAHVLTQFGLELDMNHFHSLTQNNHKEGEVTKAEFILKMLIWLGRISVQDVSLASQKFDLLDVDHDGSLTELDCRTITARERWNVAIRTVLMRKRVANVALGMLADLEK